jgi:type II restriction/modification system DNA methylase subunit YeeA
MLNPETLKILDPACGSGHILVEAYDILKAIYLDCGYRQRDIPKLILENNLYGLDIDDRAAQLAGFALMMKAREDDRRIFSRGVKLNVLAIQASEGLEVRDEWLVGNHEYDTEDLNRVLRDLVALFADAKTLGSLIRVPDNIAPYLPSVQRVLTQLTESGDLFVQQTALSFLPLVDQALILAQRYDAVVANPPYMGGKGMNGALKDFAKKQFPDSKSDLFAMFIERFLSDEWLVASGEYGVVSDRRNTFVAMVTMQSWMFLSSYEKFREKLLEDKTISSMIHLGARAFPEISGEVVQTTAFVFHQQKLNDYKPVFFRLIEGNTEQKETALRLNQNRFDKTSQDNFKKIPGSPIAYWLSKEARLCFEQKKLSDYFVSDGAVKTGDNEKYIRFWWEITPSKISVNGPWRKHPKGGAYRKWYGNLDSVVRWDEAALNHYRNDFISRILNEKYWNLQGISWSAITSGNPSFRLLQTDEVANNAALCIFPNTFEYLYFALGFLNSKVVSNLIQVITQTLNMLVGDMMKLPFLIPTQSKQHLFTIATECIALAQSDWDNHETSWDFTENPLIRQLKSDECLVASDENKKLTTHRSSLATCFHQWQTQNRAAILEMQRLEEENNRLFIEAYGLQDELTPEVPIEQITLKINPYYRYKVPSDENSEEWRVTSDETKLTTHHSSLTTKFQFDTIAELISYAIGCMMGRYRLDRPGLIYAHSGNQNFWEIYEGGLSDEWRVTSDEKKPSTHHSSLITNHFLPGVINHDQRASSKELPRPDRVAEINGIGGANISNDQGVPERGVIRTNESNSACGGVDSVEHCRGASTEINSGIPQLSIDSPRIESGSRNANTDSATSGLCNKPTNSGNYESAGRDFPNAQQSTEQTELSGEWLVTSGEKNTHHSPLTTNHFKADRDGILPISGEGWFKDDACQRLNEFLQAVWGASTLEANKTWLADSLGRKPRETADQTLNRYLSNQFYKDHLQTYKKRPIYWLFSSGKQKAFECLVYLHRYNESTLARMRTEYVTPLLGKYSAYIEQLNKQIADAASTAEANRLKKEQQTLEKKQTELRQFDDKLKHYADRRIKLDFDDGVKVNYGKFGDLLAEVKAVTGGSGE